MPANDARPMASSTDTQSQPDASALPGGNTPASFSNDAFTYSFGAQPRSGGLTQFRLWAPAQKAITLEVEGHPPLPMSRRDDGFHEAQTSCVCEARYRYRINPDLAIPDPASRLQAGDVHDASVVVGSGNYTWRHPDWAGRPWCDTVLYEVHPGVAGGFTGIQQRLAGLAELGITAIELMPVADFSGARNWGYDGVLPYAPDTTYGTPEQLKALIDTAHGLNLMVFLDVVYNHFGPEGNYQGLLAPEFFRTDRHTPWGPAIDFRKPQVRRFFAENALYWLNEYRFDGLRLDAVHAISELDWLPEMAHFVRQHVDPKRHVHLVLENDNNAAHLLENGFEAQWNDDIHHVLHHLLTGETQGYYMDYAVQPAQKLARALAEGFVYQGQPMNWRNGAARGESSGHLPSTAFVFFLQNHDQTGNRAFGERLISLVGSNVSALRAAIALQLLSPQIPLIFMG
ncbi:MAG TPA: malto-oligosyltrehalose trehalohydrolase, partial [Eoetvoesiella sp.]